MMSNKEHKTPYLRSLPSYEQKYLNNDKENQARERMMEINLKKLNNLNVSHLLNVPKMNFVLYKMFKSV